MLKPRLLQHTRVRIVFEMAIVERYSNAIQPQLCEELRICIREEILQPLVKEELVLLITEHLAHRRSMLRLVAGVSGDEVLHASISSQSA